MDRSKLRSSKKVVLREIEFEIFRINLNEQIAAAEAAKHLEGTESHRFALLRETMARMVYVDGQPLGADAGIMDIDLVFALAPLVSEVTTGALVPEPPNLEVPVTNGADHGEAAPVPKGAS